jgi:hypothetical protein
MVSKVLVVVRNYGVEVYSDADLDVTCLELKIDGFDIPMPPYVLPMLALPFDELAEDERDVLRQRGVIFP